MKKNAQKWPGLRLFALDLGREIKNLAKRYVAWSLKADKAENPTRIITPNLH
ncbi:MAG: hypothetical protein LIP02_04160 [Bacteroidales bacterium]|nr:hypothetical protein [Bacteroidales bacterium]